MGLDIKRNKKGLYKAKSTISDELIHDKKWITEDELKKALIEREFFNFVEKVIKIDMEFPSGYYVNDHCEYIKEKSGAGSRFLLDNWDSDAIEKKYNEICERLKIEF
jgi:hypothetical protein